MIRWPPGTPLLVGVGYSCVFFGSPQNDLVQPEGGQSLGHREGLACVAPRWVWALWSWGGVWPDEGGAEKITIHLSEQRCRERGL